MCVSVSVWGWRVWGVGGWEGVGGVCVRECKRMCVCGGGDQIGL